VNNKDNGSSRNINSNGNNNKDKYGINAKKILVTSVVLVFLLSSTVLTQNQTMLVLSSQQQQRQEQSSSLTPPPSLSITSLAYAEKIKIKNKSLINDISDKVIKNNDGNDNDELQSILQQIQTQISLIAGQDKATNAIKQIRSVLELNPNGPLAQSLLLLAKQQAAGNIEGVNKVTTDVARYAATGDTNGILFVLEQVGGGGGAEGSPSPQKQQQIQPSLQSLPSASTSTTFFSNNSNSDNINEPSSLSSQAQLPQITTSQLAPSSAAPQLPWLTSSPSPSPSYSSPSSTATGLSSSQSLLPPYNNPEQQQQQQQIQPPQPPEQQQQLVPQSLVSSAPEQLQQSLNNHQNAALISPLASSPLPSSQSLQSQLQQQQLLPPQSSISSPSPYPTTNLSTYNNRNNATDANTAASNSSPHSTIRVTSIDQQTNHPPPTLYSPMSNSTQPQDQTQQRAQLEQRIQEVINELNSSNRNDAASLPTFIQKS
jgi:hypothetical protein